MKEYWDGSHPFYARSWDGLQEIFRKTEGQLLSDSTFTSTTRYENLYTARIADESVTYSRLAQIINECPLRPINGAVALCNTGYAWTGIQLFNQPLQTFS